MPGQGPVNNTARRTRAPELWQRAPTVACVRGRAHHRFTQCRRDTQTAQTALRCPWEARALGRRGRR